MNTQEIAEKLGVNQRWLETGRKNSKPALHVIDGKKKRPRS